MTGSKNRTLLKVSDVKALTGWETKEDLRKARELGWIEMIRSNNKIFYIAESIRPQFLKQQAS